MKNKVLDFDRNSLSLTSKDWWQLRRRQYNKGLIISGICAFILYLLVVELIVIPKGVEVEITLFTIFFQWIGYLIMMGIANLLYNLGALAERIIKPKDRGKFRSTSYKWGSWFSFSLPFLIPIVLLIIYL